ncbi:MAG: sugar ABC transporter substrate-binding protein [Treponema sp.]|nr:sugar ABC transporter substrate-binding protein [Treponema sp.]
MKKKSGFFLVLLVFITVALVSAGGARAADDDVTREVFRGTNKTTVKVVMQAGGYRQDALAAVFQEYINETGNSIELRWVPNTSWAEYFNKIQTMIAAGDAPDCFMVAIEGFEIFRSRDLLEPLDPYFSKYPAQKAILDGEHPRLQAPFIVDGKLYGLGIEWNNVVAHVNLNILNEAGLPMPPANWNYDTFLEYAKKMTYTRPDGTKVYGTSIPDSYFTASAWLFNNGASFMNNNWTRSTINSPEAVEVFQFFQDLIYKYEVAPRPPIETEQLFMNDQIGLYYAGRWPVRTFTDSGFSAVDVVRLPTNKSPAAIFGSGCFPVLKASKNKDAAFLLVSKLSSLKSQEILLTANSIPTNVQAMDNMVKNSTFPKNTAVFRTDADVARAVESPNFYADIQTAFDRAMSKILANESTPKAALDTLAREIDELIANQ